MTHRLTLLFVSVISIVLTSGCGRPAPEGLPPLFPCVIRIVDGQKPVGGIDVNLVRREGHGGWILHAKTDTGGNAKIHTAVGSYRASGVPAGNYDVFFNEQVDLPDEFSLSEDEKMNLSSKELEVLDEKKQAYLRQHSRLPSSPVELTVTESGGTLEIDIAKDRQVEE